LEKKDRRFAHQQFASGQASFLVATIAYGMGVDLPNIRLVLHW
jgi:superfamily II DNA helicase RecQ